MRRTLPRRRRTGVWRCTRSGPGRPTPWRAVAALCVAVGVVALAAEAAAASAPRSATLLEPADTVPGYLARLLVNESPFPGERGWTSEADTKAAMLSILWVLESRRAHIPDGYRQEHVAAVRSDDVVDLITVGGKKGQCDGFYRDANGRFTAVPRVEERIRYLEGIAGKGTPGRFARLLSYAQGLASAYVDSGIDGADRFVNLQRVDGVVVTGRAYAWMTDHGGYAPGGNFVRIPNDDQGSLGGNRFFTLRRLP